ncbi:hypothetical protein PN466_01205 [Roseofilum reptotaenium CS-1145]|uniref:Uncharacterized protein n=1 Tax=Roseofilum reptotaenium AO1-A TaxID=1925591 RepID=A0A1L9QK52_9CYAN|nr:hypothetical protein [Roseofilum reptotaenium]MDB9515578.1 hypothetical protein [Roseofilum reptotaenium CS-1145]OJJ15742.1 hypothetical protein BI308_24155 [Roseofilum reptotaenium AO1-A]
MKGLKKLPPLGNVIKILGINLVLMFLLLEGVCLGFYAAQHQQLYYGRSPDNSDNPEDNPINLDQQGIRLEENITEILHPFLGYIAKPGTGFGGFEFQSVFNANNYGLVSQLNYPYIRQNPNQVLVGIFGGSVATFYYMNEIENPTLARTLNNLPEFANKEIVLLNFSQGGYKQPQQLLALNYFLSQGQELDLAINIDGFNEVAIANNNIEKEIAPSMPSALQVMPLVQLANNNLSTEQMKIMLEVIGIKDKLKNSLQGQQDCVLALCYFWEQIRSTVLIRNYYDRLEDFDDKRKKSATPDESLIYLQPWESQGTESDYESMAQIWIQSSLAMSSVLQARNIPYFHILQPNQYYPTERQFSAEEQQQFAPENNRRNPYLDGVQLGYPYLLQASQELLDNGIYFFNGVTAFDGEPDTVYIDTCCHYNQTGRNIFANFVASQIALTLSPPNLQ